jgi:hypothetical protein
MIPALPLRGLLSHLPSVSVCLSLGILAIGLLGQAFADAPATAVRAPVPLVAQAGTGGPTKVPESSAVSGLMAGLGLALLLRRRY